MLKRLLAIGLIVAMISVNFSRFVAYASFQVNKDYIAKVLCENKSRPEMHCNGKCYLMKKLKQAEENEKKQSVKDNFGQLDTSFFQQSSEHTLVQLILISVVQNNFPIYSYKYCNHYIKVIFRPPKQIA